jgi:hypothetical protein
VVSCLRIFINAFIFEIYEGQIGKGIFRKELLKLNQSQIIDSKNNRDFLNKSLKDIFSEDISTKYNNYLINHNKALIQDLLNEPDANKKITFENLSGYMLDHGYYMKYNTHCVLYHTLYHNKLCFLSLIEKESA